MNKKAYWKVVSKDYPEGVIYSEKDGAMADSQELREMYDEKGVYVRKVSMTEEYVNSMEEI